MSLNFKFASIYFREMKTIIRQQTDFKPCCWGYDILLKDAIIEIGQNKIEINATQIFVHHAHVNRAVSSKFLETIIIPGSADVITKRTKRFPWSKQKITYILQEGMYLLKKTEPFKLVTSHNYELFI